MNVIDWLRASADYMVADRPDVYDQETALEELSLGIESLREYAQPYACLMFTSYMLSRVLEEDVEEFFLTRKVSSLILFGEEEACRVYGHLDEISLPSVLDEGQDF